MSQSNVVRVKFAEENLKKLADEAGRTGRPIHAEQSPLVSGLVEACGGRVLTAAGYTCAVLSTAVDRKWVDPHSLIQQLLVWVPSASHPHVIVSLVCDLLWKEVSIYHNKDGHYPIQWNTHPLVSVLESQPELITTCCQCAVELVSIHFNSLSLFERFFKYLLLLPNNSIALSGDVLFSELLALGQLQSALCQPLVTLILETIPLLQCCDIDHVWRVERRVYQLTQVVLHQQGKAPEQLLDHILAVCVECVQCGVPSLRPLRCLQELVSTRTIAVNTHHVMAIAWLLLKHVLSLPTVSILLTIAGIIKREAVRPCDLLLLSLPLVSLLSQPAPLSQTSSVNVCHLAADVLTNCLSIDHTQIYKSGKHEIPLSPSLSPQYMLLSATAAYYANCAPRVLCSILEEQLQGNSKLLLSSGVDHIALVVCAFCSMRDISPVSVNLLPSIAKLDPSLAPSLLSFVVHLLTKIDQPDQQLTLLYTIPSFALDCVSAELVAAIILTLSSSSPSLYPLAVRLMCRACEKQDCLFTKLCTLLSHPPSSPSPSLMDEWLIATAASIADICSTCSTLHGEEMLRYISSTLSKTDSHPAVSAMLTAALTSICLADVCDVAVLWQLLSHRLQPGVSIAGDKALCSFYSLARFLSGERASEKKFRALSLTHLWLLTTHDDVGVATLAMTAISQFPVDELTFRFLPLSLLHLVMVEDSVGSSEQPLSGRQTVKVASNSSASAIGLSSLLVAVIEKELPVPRGLVHTALKNARAPSAIDREVVSARKQLQQLVTSSTCSADPVTAVLNLTSELNAALLVSDVSLRNLQHVWQTALIKWEGANVSCDREIEWSCLGYFSLVSAVIDFMAVLLSYQRKEKPAGDGDNEKIAMQRAYDSLMNELLSLVHGGGHVSPSGVLLSLVGLVCTSGAPPSLSLVHAVLEVELAVMKGQWPSAWSSHCMQLAPFLQLIQSTSPDDLLVAALVIVPFLVHTLTSHQLVSPSLSLLTELLNELKLRANSSGLAALSFSTSLLHLFPVELNLLQLLIPPVHTPTDSLLIWVLQSMNGKENWQEKAEHGVFVGCEELFSSPILTLAQDIELACISLALSLPLLVLVHNVSSQTVMGVVQQLADVASERVDLPAAHWSLGAALYGACSVGENASDAMIDGVTSRWMGQALSAVTSEQVDTNTVLSALLGLAGLLGVSSPLKLPGLIPSAMVERLLVVVIPFLMQCCHLHDPLLHCTALWLLTTICRHHSEFNRPANRVPADLKYIGTDSGLEAIYQLLQRRDTVPSTDTVAGIIEALIVVDSHLPPADWSQAILPLLKNSLLQHRVVMVITRHANSPGWSHVVQYCCHPFVFSSLSCDSQAHLLENLPSLLTAQQCSCLLLTAAHCSAELLRVNHTQNALASSVAACIREHLNNDAIEVLLEVATELAHHSPPLPLLLPSQSFVRNLAECCALNPDVCTNGALHNPFTCCWVTRGHVGMSAMESVLSEVLPSSSDELSMIWLRSTVKQLISDSDRKMHHQLMLISYLTNWISSCEQVTDCMMENFTSLFNEVVIVYSSLPLSLLSHWSLLTAASSLPPSLVTKIIPTALELSGRREKLLRKFFLALISAMKHSQVFTTQHRVWTSVAHIL